MPFSIRIKVLHRIVGTEGIRTDAMVLLREGILGESAAEDWVVLSGSVVDVADCIPEGYMIE